MSFLQTNKDFIRLMGGQIGSTLADLLVHVSIILFIYSESSSLASTTFAIVLSTLSKMLGSFLATQFLDKVKSKKLIIISWLLKIIFVVGIQFLLDNNSLSLYLFLLAYSLLSAISSPAVGTLISHLNSGEALVRLNSIYSLSLQLIQTAAWGISIPIIKLLGLNRVFMIIFILYCYSIVLIYGIKKDFTLENGNSRRQSFRLRFRDGIRALKANDIVRNITLMDLAETVANIIWTQSFMLAFTLTILNSESEWLGYQTSFYFIGSIAGGSSVLLLLRSFSKNAGKVIVASSLIVALTSLIYTFNTSPVLALILNFIIGFPYQIRDVMQQSLIQEKADAKTIGRVLAIRDIGVSIVYIIALVAGGFLGERFGVRLVYFMASIIYLVVSLIITNSNSIRDYSMG